MTTPIPPHPITTGSRLTAPLLNGGWWLTRKPVAELRSTSAQTTTTGQYTAAAWQVEVVDTDPDGVGGHSTVTTTTRYTARYAGWYRVSGSCTWGSSAVGRRGARWSVSGTPVPGSAVLIPGQASAVCSIAADMLVYLGVGDYLELQWYQDSGGSLATLTSSDNQARMTVEWSRARD